MGVRKIAAGLSKSTEDGALGQGAHVGISMQLALYVHCMACCSLHAAIIVLKLECCKRSVALGMVLRAKEQMLGYVT